MLDPIEVRTYGTRGPCVVLLHGGPGVAGDMGSVAGRLQGQFRVLEPLQRTSGTVPLTVARHVADLREVLRGSLRQGPVRLVGFSWGAMLALTFAARYPTEMDRVILIGCGTFDRRSRAVYQANMAERIEAEDRQRAATLEAQLAAETDPRRRNALFAELGAIYTRAQSFRPLPSSAEDHLCYDAAGFHETWQDAVSLQQQGIQPAEFARIHAPVTMIHGQQDPHPGPLIYESLSPLIRDLQYRELPRCGHTPWNEREASDVFYELLIECLR